MQAERSATGVAPAIRPADASIETPNSAGLRVGLRAGELAPDFAFSGYFGERTRLSDFRGQPVIVNFWASWCGPCRAEMADLERALFDHRDGGLAVIAVNNGESYATGRSFLEASGVHLTAFAVDPQGDIASRYLLRGMPTTYFLDAQGVVTGVVVGQLDAAALRRGIEGAAADGLAGD
jgi:thiol-disulfide isomerase/thioredoxin